MDVEFRKETEINEHFCCVLVCYQLLLQGFTFTA